MLKVERVPMSFVFGILGWEERYRMLILLLVSRWRIRVSVFAILVVIIVA